MKGKVDSDLDIPYKRTSLHSEFLKRNKELYCCFKDLEKAFDKVARLQIWKAVRNLKVTEELVG